MSINSMNAINQQRLKGFGRASRTNIGKSYRYVPQALAQRTASSSPAPVGQGGTIAPRLSVFNQANEPGARQQVGRRQSDRDSNSSWNRPQTGAGTDMPAGSPVAIPPLMRQIGGDFIQGAGFPYLKNLGVLGLAASQAENVRPADFMKAAVSPQMLAGPVASGVGSVITGQLIRPSLWSRGGGMIGSMGADYLSGGNPILGAVGNVGGSLVGDAVGDFFDKRDKEQTRDYFEDKYGYFSGRRRERAATENIREYLNGPAAPVDNFLKQGYLVDGEHFKADYRGEAAEAEKEAVKRENAGVSKSSFGYNSTVKSAGDGGGFMGLNLSLPKFSFGDSSSPGSQNNERSEGHHSSSSGGESFGVFTGTGKSASSGYHAGQSGGDTVLCTELHRQGILPDHLYKASKKYSRTIDPVIIAGYHHWAKPCARAMARSRMVTLFFMPIVFGWTKQMAFRVGERPAAHWGGKWIEKVGIWACKKIGENLTKAAKLQYGFPRG